MGILPICPTAKNPLMPFAKCNKIVRWCQSARAWEQHLTPCDAVNDASDAMTTLRSYSRPPTLAPPVDHAVASVVILEADDPPVVLVVEWTCVGDVATLMDEVGMANCAVLFVCADADGAFEALRPYHTLMKENMVRVVQTPISGPRLRAEVQQVDFGRCILCSGPQAQG